MIEMPRKGYHLPSSAHSNRLLPCFSFHGKIRGFGRTISKHCIDRPLVGTGRGVQFFESQTNLGKDLTLDNAIF